MKLLADCALCDSRLSGQKRTVMWRENKSVPFLLSGPFLRTMQFSSSAEPAVNNRRTQPKGPSPQHLVEHVVKRLLEQEL